MGRSMRRVPAMESISFSVNGQPAAARADHPHLLSALREELGITSPKDGCSPSGQCGACTVLLDGEAIRSCVEPISSAAGRAVVTIEGLAGLIAFDQPHAQLLDLLCCRKPPLAGVANTLATDHVPALGSTRVKDAVIVDMAVRATHRTP